MKKYLPQSFLIYCILFVGLRVQSQNHPEIYVTADEKSSFLQRIETSARTSDFIAHLKNHVEPFVDKHKTDPEWIISRLQMYWSTKYERIYVNGMDFSHGEGQAPVPTVRFSGSRDWDTDFLRPELEDVLPYMDDERGVYLQNGEKEDQPWEWTHPSETGHVIERINEEILTLSEEAAFIYWLYGEEKYAVFASDILMKYLEGMHYREPPRTVENHGNALLMGLQTFEVIHERIVVPVTLSYDFLYDYLVKKGHDIGMAQAVFRKWADQEIKYGVPGNNWNMMQARYITYLAVALEDDSVYGDGKGQQYYIDQVLNQNSEKQKALKDVLKNYDPETAIWPEVASYSMMVSDDLLEIYCLVDKVMNNNLLASSPILEKAILANFNYLFPNDFTVAYGDAKHSRLRFNSLELLISQYRKYKQIKKEILITSQLKRYIEKGVYSREEIGSLYELFFYVEDLMGVPAASGFNDLVKPTFYSPNVSWIVQRNGNTQADGMMISKNASLGNHSHTNGVNIELYAQGMVIAPDAAAGVSYWSGDHREYYSRFPAHNTVVVDGISDYRNMRGTQAFAVKAIYPSYAGPLLNEYTFSDVSFTEPSTNAMQDRLTGTIRTSESSGYFVDIFRSSKVDGSAKKHEYIFHSQGSPAVLFDSEGQSIATSPTEELSSKQGDQVGYDYFTNKEKADYLNDFYARFMMENTRGKDVNVNVWIKGFEDRALFTVMAPYSRAIHEESVPPSLYHQPIPTLIVQQKGEARTKPFVAIIDAFEEENQMKVHEVNYFSSLADSEDFIGIHVLSGATREDFIYNATEINLKHEFDEGLFAGLYGVVSYEDQKLASMLLGKGTQIEKSGWKIQIDQPATVKVGKEGEVLSIEADAAFVLTFPMLKSSKQIVLKSGTKVFTGKIIKSGKERFAEVSLPALTNELLRISY